MRIRLHPSVAAAVESNRGVLKASQEVNRALAEYYAKKGKKK